MRWLERQGWDVGGERVDGWSQKVRVSEFDLEIDMEQVDESLRQKETEKVPVTCQRADSLQLTVFVKGRDAVCSTEDQTVVIRRIHWDTTFLRESIFNSRWISSGLCTNESSQFEICNTLGWFCSSQVLVVSGHPRVRHPVRPSVRRCLSVLLASMFLWTRGKSWICLCPIAGWGLRDDPEASSRCCELHEACVVGAQPRVPRGRNSRRSSDSRRYRI